MIQDRKQEKEFVAIQDRIGAADYKMDIEVDDQISLESIVVEPFIIEEPHE